MTEVMEMETKTRKPRVPETAEAKKARSLRRDASMLQRLAEGSSDPKSMLAHAAALLAKANAIAPEKPKAEPRPLCAYTFEEDGEQHGCGARAMAEDIYCFSHSDPLSKLTEAEWNQVEGYFIANLRQSLLEGFSWRKLKEIAAR